MKHTSLFAALAASALAGAVALASRPSPPKPPPHRVVFEATSDDPQAWESVLNNVDNVRRALGPTSIEVVVHGRGLAFLTSATVGSARHRMEVDAAEGVVFAACENTMRRQKVTKEALVPFATTVDSGVGEVVRKQESGWSYVRSGM